MPGRRAWMHPIDEWLAATWPRVAAVEVWPSRSYPEPRRRRAWIDDARELRQLRALTTAGVYTGDIVRSFGFAELHLLDGDGDLLGTANVYDDRVSWERARLRNDLLLADPDGLTRLLVRLGAWGDPANAPPR